MWFKFPPGVGGINVQQQEFSPEVTENEKAFFRAPDHFAPLILDLPGFTAERPQGPDVPDDLPPSRPGEAGAVDLLTQQISALKEELEQKTNALVQVTKERDLVIEKLKPIANELAEFKKKAA